MRRSSFVDFSLAAIGWSVLLSSSAYAGSVQTFVSITANANNTVCTRTAPCTDFGLAYSATVAGGEIICLDSGYFGPFPKLTITHSITIDCSGTNGSLSDSGFIINTAAADTVILKGLDFDSSSLPASGNPQNGLINFSGAGTLHVENTRIKSIKGSQFSGILFAPTGPAKLIVADSSITNIGTAGTTAGIYIKPASGVTANVAIEGSHIEANYFGIIADGTAGGIVRGIVSDSFVTNNANNGVTVSTTSASVVFTIDNTKITGNNYGLVAGGGANAGLLVRRSVINSNATGILTTNGAAIYSYRDNSLNGNFTTDGAFTGVVNTQ